MTREQGEQLQKECKEVAKPYIELLSDIHNYSTMRMIFSPENPSVLPLDSIPRRRSSGNNGEHETGSYSSCR